MNRMYVNEVEVANVIGYGMSRAYITFDLEEFVGAVVHVNITVRGQHTLKIVLRHTEPLYINLESEHYDTLVAVAKDIQEKYFEYIKQHAGVNRNDI